MGGTSLNLIQSKSHTWKWKKFQMYPLNPLVKKLDKVWSKCVIAIDKGNRMLNRKGVLGFSGLKRWNGLDWNGMERWNCTNRAWASISINVTGGTQASSFLPPQPPPLEHCPSLSPQSEIPFELTFVRGNISACRGYCQKYRKPVCPLCVRAKTQGVAKIYRSLWGSTVLIQQCGMHPVVLPRVLTPWCYIYSIFYGCSVITGAYWVHPEANAWKAVIFCLQVCVHVFLFLDCVHYFTAIRAHISFCTSYSSSYIDFGFAFSRVLSYVYSYASIRICCSYTEYILWQMPGWPKLCVCVSVCVCVCKSVWPCVNILLTHR